MKRLSFYIPLNFLGVLWLILMAQPSLAMVVSITTKGQPLACGINSVKNVVFGNYDVFSSTIVTSQGNVVIQCKGGSPPFKVTVNINPGGSGTATQRYMTTVGTDHLLYNIYSNSARTTIWGDGTTAPAPTFNIPNHKKNTFIIYGEILPIQQNVTVGDYNDTL